VDVILKVDFMTNDADSLRKLRNLARDEWHSWLKRNHSREKEAWLVFYKKHTGKGKMSYPEAVDEALCFGWIGGRLKRIDDEKHLRRLKGTLSADGRKYRRHCAEAAQLTLILTSCMFSGIIPGTGRVVFLDSLP
jgi:hypothetical protein